jgi:hypothetical protein
MAAEKIERAGIGFEIGRQAGPVVIEVRLHHDTIPALKGVRVAFELLNGTTLDQAKKTLDVLKENLIGLRVTTPLDDKAQAASG